MATKLGYQPNKGEIILSIGADWICSVSEKNTVWPAGTAVWCEIGETRWDATVTESTATATFIIQADDTDPIEDKTAFRIYRQYAGTPTIEYLWFVGTVKRVDA